MPRTLALVGAALAAAALPLAAGAKGPRYAEPVPVTVERVVDGDSLFVRTAPEAKPLELRLDGIDAPEICQPGGPEALAMLKDLLQRGPVTMQAGPKDNYQRVLARVRVDGVLINERMVAEGMAWSTRTKWNRGPYIDKEKMATALKRGLHASPGAVAPWDFRKSKGPCEPAGAASAPGPAPAAR